MRILRLMSRGTFGTKEKCEIHVWARVFEVTSGAPNEKKIGERLRMQFSSFSYPFMAF